MSTITHPKPEHYERAKSVADAAVTRGLSETPQQPYSMALAHVQSELAEAYAKIDSLERDVAALEAGELRDTELDELRFQINERLQCSLDHKDPDERGVLHTSRVRLDLPDWLPVELAGEKEGDDLGVPYIVHWTARLNSIDGHQAIYDITQEG